MTIYTYINLTLNIGIIGGETTNYPTPEDNILNNILPGKEPSESVNNGLDDADTANVNIYCPNPKLGIMKLCEEEENSEPNDEDFNEAYSQ